MLRPKLVLNRIGVSIQLWHTDIKLPHTVITWLWHRKKPSVYYWRGKNRG